MRVAYAHLARFPVQRRLKELPSLAGQPLALIEESRGQRRVAFASTAALKAGVRPGMVLAAACALVPELEAHAYQPEADRQALVSLGEVLMAVAPAFMLDAPDGLWLDASAARLCGGEPQLAERIVALCQEQGYWARVVVGGELFTTRALARYGTQKASAVPTGAAAQALAGLPLLALDVPEHVAARAFSELGLATLGAVAALPTSAVVARLGASGLRAHRLARGEDDSRFVATPPAEVLEESLELEWPADALGPLLFPLKTVFDRLCARLSGRRRAAVKLRLHLKLDPEGEEELPLTLARPSAMSRMLLDLVKHRLEDLTLRNPVGAVRVTVEESCEDRAQQRVLGDAPEGDASLDVVLSRLATALGEDALFTPVLEDEHRPEDAYAAAEFHPPERPTGLFAEQDRSARQEAQAVAPHLAERPTRLFPKPATLDVELDGQGAPTSARIQGRRRRVLSLAGPERLGGAWWEKTPFKRDYYRVFFEGIGPVWIYRDGHDGRFYLQGLFD